MKVLLVIPPYTHAKGEQYFLVFPLGIAYIAGALEAAGHEVKVIDSLIEDPNPKYKNDGTFLLGLEWNNLMGKIKECNPDIVGVSCGFTSQFKNTEKLCKLIREYKPGIKIFGGGAHASALTNKVIKDHLIDYAIFGEAEETVVELLDTVDKKGDLSKVNGIGYLDNAGKVQITDKRPFIKNLDSLPFPAHHLFPMQKYFKFGKNKTHNFYAKRYPCVTVVTSRGCPYTCSFCSVHTVWARSWRPRSPENVLDEIELLVKKYGVREIQFEDDNLTLIKDRAMKFFQGIIDRGIDISWTTPNGVVVNTLDEELIQKMKESGCYRINIGIESGNQHVVDTIVKKPLSLDYCRKVVKMLKKHKISVTGFFVIGMPGETIRNIKETIEFAKTNDFDDVLFSIATPYPGTELWDTAIKEGYIKQDPYGSPETLKPKYAAISTKDFTTEQVEKLRNKAYFEFQLSKLKRNPVKYFLRYRNYTSLSRYSKFILYNKIFNPLYNGVKSLIYSEREKLQKTEMATN